VATRVSSWRHEGEPLEEREGGQIDLIIERADRIVHLCEIKFSISPYVITDGYGSTLRKRTALFKDETGCNKTVLNTFITTFGVSDGKHKSIVDREVILDDLFSL